MTNQKAAERLAGYPYVKKASLPTLQAEGASDELVFRGDGEEAVVRFTDAGIAAVTHKDLACRSERVIEAAAAHHIVVGEKNWTRDVYHFLKPSDHPHFKLRLGYTAHQGLGTWSSLPHDFENRPEPGFEEVFFYLLTGGPRRAYQVGRGLWADGSAVDSIWPVQDRAFSTVPMGYHPVVGEPGCQVRYIWAYLAKEKRWEKI